MVREVAFFQFLESIPGKEGLVGFGGMVARNFIYKDDPWQNDGGDDRYVLSKKIPKIF